MMNNYFNTGYSNLFSNNNSGLNNLSSLYGEYASIKSGSYRKLLNSHYAKDSSSSPLSSLSDIGIKKADKTLTSIKKDSDSLSSSANALVVKGSKSLFNKKEIETTDAVTGEKTKSLDYDMEAIVKSINSFVSDYNKVNESSTNTSNINILRNASYMSSQTNAYSKGLASVGITIGFDNKLKVDEDKLKSADISSVKNLFNGTNSFAYRSAQKASQIGQAATKAATSSTYGSSGKYSSYNYNTSLFNNYF